jgi:GntR family transcriptional regulator, arabinose operon transcriptional repressor
VKTELGLDESPEALPKYRQIADQLRAKIMSAEYAPGEKLPTDANLSEQFKSSRLTVIKALRQLEGEGLVSRKAGSGTYIGLQVREDPHSFGLLIPDLGQGEIFEPICQGMARAGTSSRQELIWGNTSSVSLNDKETQALELCKSFIARKVDGVFFAPLELSAHKEEVNQQILIQLEEAGIPIVLLDRSTRPFPEPTTHDLVGIDNWREGFRMAKYLLDLGCARLGFVLRPGSAPTVEARIAGLSEALRQRGMSAPPSFILRIDPTDKKAVQEWMRKFRPDGILCANDYTAGQLMHSLGSFGVQVPKDVRIVGFDDVKYASILPVPLTTLRQPCHEIGKAAMKAMLARIEDPSMVPRTISLDCEIIVRVSCGARLNESS